MSLILDLKLAKNQSERNAMKSQISQVVDYRIAGHNSISELLRITNAGRTPADAYREFDSTTKIEVNQMGEFATLTRLMQVSRPVSIGKTKFEYRKNSGMENGQTSLSGQTAIILDQTDYGYAGVPIPIHDKSFGRIWRDYEAMRAEGFDALVDDARGARPREAR